MQAGQPQLPWPKQKDRLGLTRSGIFQDQSAGDLNKILLTNAMAITDTASQLASAYQQAAKQMSCSATSSTR